MPCDQILQVTTNFERCDQALLFKTLQDLGYNPSRSGSSIYFRSENGNVCTLGYGQLSMQNGEQKEVDALATKIRAKFQDNAVRRVAKQHGFEIKVKDGKVVQLLKRRK